MTLVAFPKGLFWPYGGDWSPAQGSTITMDADTEKVAAIGRVYWTGRAASKTINTSSTISWLGGATAVFDNAASTLDVGFQGVGSGGPVAQPDGVYTVQTTLTTAADASPTLTTTNSWHTATMTSGSATLAHGDMVAIVWDMTNQAGADTIAVVGAIQLGGSITMTFPTVNAFAGSAWGATGQGTGPNVAFTASDGTIGWLDSSVYLGSIAALIWADSTNPDENGMIFQVPFDCKIDALWTHMRTVDNTSDFTISLFSTPESGASSIASVAVDAAQTGLTGSDRIAVYNLASEISLSKNTDYCIAVKATGAGNIRVNRVTLGNASYRGLFPASTTLRNVTRNGGSGDFGSSSTTLMIPMGVRISQVDDGTGTGSSGGVTPLGNGLHPIGTGFGA